LLVKSTYELVAFFFYLVKLNTDVGSEIVLSLGKDDLETFAEGYSKEILFF